MKNNALRDWPYCSSVDTFILVLTKHWSIPILILHITLFLKVRFFTCTLFFSILCKSWHSTYIKRSKNSVFSTFLIVHSSFFRTPQFPHSTISTLPSFHTPQFPHSTFFHTPHFPHFPHSPFSALPIFHTTTNASLDRLILLWRFIYFQIVVAPREWR